MKFLRITRLTPVIHTLLPKYMAILVKKIIRGHPYYYEARRRQTQDFQDHPRLRVVREFGAPSLAVGRASTAMKRSPPSSTAASPPAPRASPVGSTPPWAHQPALLGPYAPRPRPRPLNDIVATMTREFRLDLGPVLFDATNFFTYINSFNQRSQLAQRGHSRRAAGRCASSAWPCWSGPCCIPGNRPDAPTFLAADLAVARTTLGRGSLGRSNQTLVTESRFGVQTGAVMGPPSPFSPRGVHFSLAVRIRRPARVRRPCCSTSAIIVP